jgi:hypothetical protein
LAQELSGMSATARAPAPDSQEGRECRLYRFTFWRRDDEQAIAAFELFLVAEEAAAKLASELLQRSGAELAEVWSEGRLIVRLVKP